MVGRSCGSLIKACADLVAEYMHKSSGLNFRHIVISGEISTVYLLPSNY